MNIKITDKELEATDAIQNYIEKKMERAVKYFGDDIDVQATIKAEGNNQIAEIHIIANGKRFIAISEKEDLYASIDEDIDILERQMRKFKEKNADKNLKDSIRFTQELEGYDNEVVEDEIVKTTFYSITPMTEEDAKLKLSERPKDMFMAFINSETDKVNVIYKLKDGKNFGLSEPEN